MERRYHLNDNLSIAAARKRIVVTGGIVTDEIFAGENTITKCPGIGVFPMYVEINCHEGYAGF